MSRSPELAIICAGISSLTRGTPKPNVNLLLTAALSHQTIKQSFLLCSWHTVSYISTSWKPACHRCHHCHGSLLHSSTYPENSNLMNTLCNLMNTLCNLMNTLWMLVNYILNHITLVCVLEWYDMYANIYFWLLYVWIHLLSSALYSYLMAASSSAMQCPVPLSGGFLLQCMLCPVLLSGGFLLQCMLCPVLLFLGFLLLETRVCSLTLFHLFHFCLFLPLSLTLSIFLSFFLSPCLSLSKTLLSHSL